MGSSLVIVAIPEEQDRVWKISSEKVPHLTLLYLGADVDQIANVDQIMQFVDHAVTLSEHGPFYLDVDSRGKLGEEEADVLFFNKRSWNLKWIRQFRGQLLQNQAIRTAYDSTPQHTAPQDWLPHLTLGYPDAPAKELPNDGFDHPFYTVCFDRIAVWAEDSNGPEFKLEWPDRELEGDLAVAYSDTQKAALMHNLAITQTATERGEKFLEHYGKKGMKWGVRNDRQGRHRLDPKGHSLEGDIARAAIFPAGANVPALIRLGKRWEQSKTESVTIKGVSKKVTPRKAAKLDQRWEKKAKYDSAAFVKVHNAMADHFNSHIDALNSKPEYEAASKRGDLHDYSKPITQKYHKDVDKLTADGYKQAIEQVHGTSPTGNKEAVFTPEGGSTFNAEHGYRIEIRAKGDGSAAPALAAPGSGNVGSAGSGTSAFKHAAGDETLVFQLQMDEQGRILEANTAEAASLAQTVELGEAFLAHYGKKGMKWGVRNTSRSTSTPAGLFSREPPKAVAPTATSKVPHGSRRKTKVETEGGENHPAHEDALKVAKSAAKLKKSGTKALSNNELRDLAERIRLEAQATELTRSSGSKWIRKFLGNQGNQAANQIVRTEVDSRIRSARAK